MLEELETLPIGLQVTHTPTQVGGPTGPNHDPTAWKYKWVFKTEVAALDRPITIEQFGILAWDGKCWILPPNQRRYNCGILDQGTFAEWYSCPDGEIAPGTAAVDPQNWAGSDELADFQQKWFFVGVDSSGKKYKGEAIVRFAADNNDSEK
ncbi:hypothetical protein [Aeoliella sp.]|uniref:hypothetical protein n=1 Tax=Aeoliella sp. TaxID=2795800 RepID=UPI003CCB7CCB